MGGIAWTEEEDYLLKNCIEKYGEGKWHRIPQLAGLKRCRKSCRLRWLNYLRPNIKRGNFAEEEVEVIVKLHSLYGNRWSLIAGKLPGRTANDVKNYWNCHLSKKLSDQGVAEKAFSIREETPSSSNSRKSAGRSKSPAIVAEARDRELPEKEIVDGIENAEQYIQSQDIIQNQIQELNQNLPIEEQNGTMTLSNQQTVMEDQDGCNERKIWEDWISDMDHWIETL